MSHKADMPYASAFIQELYRYRTLSPIGAPHESKADTELNGYVIPKGVQVILAKKVLFSGIIKEAVLSVRYVLRGNTF